MPAAATQVTPRPPEGGNNTFITRLLGERAEHGLVTDSKTNSEVGQNQTVDACGKWNLRNKQTNKQTLEVTVIFDSSGEFQHIWSR